MTTVTVPNAGLKGGQHEEINYEKLLRDTPEIGKSLAKKYIQQFFQDEQYHGGGRIPNSVLTSKKNIQMVLDLHICHGVDRVYEIFENYDGEIPVLPEQKLMAEEVILQREAQMLDDDKMVDDDDFPPEVQLVVGLIHRCEKRGVPQPFVAGILVIYLELCCGIQMPDVNWL